MNILNTDRRFWTLCLCLSLVLTFILRINTLYTPVLDVDETVFGTVASVILHGGNLYLDAVDNKPPLIFILYLIIWWIFGENNMIAMHVFTNLWIVLTSIIIGAIGKRLASTYVGGVAMLVFAVATTLGEPKLMASNINIIMALPMSLSFYFFLKAETKDLWWLWLLSGAMGATASLFRVQGGIILAVVGLCILMGKSPIGKKVRRTLVLSAGAGLVWLLMYLYLLSKGTAGDAIFWTFLYGIGYVSQGEAFAFWPRFLTKTSLYVLSTLPLFAAGTFWLWHTLRERPCNKKGLYLLIWFILSWWPVCVGRRFFSHYYLMLLPQISIMAAWGVDYLKTKTWKKIFVFGMALWACVFFLTRIESVGLRGLLGIHPSDWAEVGALQCPIGEYIKERTTPSDRILVWGYAAPIYFCADRLPATRYLFQDALVGRVTGGTKFKERRGVEIINDRQGLWDKFFSDLEQNRPSYVVDVSKADFGAYRDFPLENYPLSDWLAGHNYRVEARLNGARLFRLPNQ